MTTIDWSKKGHPMSPVRIPTILITEKENGRSCIGPNGLSAYNVVRNNDPGQVLSLVSVHRPDLIILDAEMAGTSGYDLLKTLKSFYKTEHIPVVLAAEIHEDVEPCLALELGAIDFIIKPISEHLVAAKVHNYIKLYHSMMDLEERATIAKEMNPNTGLPGNRAINRRVTQALIGQEDLVVVYGDLDNFKSYNDKYGFGKGDDIITMTGDVIKEGLSQTQGASFIGHVGGDDFIFLAPVADIKMIADYIIYNFDQRVREHYSEEDVKRGFIISTDRQNHIRKFPIMTLSLAGVNLTEHEADTRYEVIADICAEVKKYAKTFNNSCFYIDRRHKRAKKTYEMTFNKAMVI